MIQQNLRSEGMMGRKYSDDFPGRKRQSREDMYRQRGDSI